MTAPDMTMPRLIDPDVLDIAAEPTAPREYHVRVDVLAAVIPALLATLADLDTRLALNRVVATDALCAKHPDFRPLAELRAEQVEELTETLRSAGVGVLYFDSAAAGLVARDISAYPERCVGRMRGVAYSHCENYADTCPIHQDAADEPARDDR